MYVGIVASDDELLPLLIILINNWFWSIKVVIANLIPRTSSLNLDMGVSGLRGPFQSKSLLDPSELTSSLSPSGTLGYSCSTKP